MASSNVPILTQELLTSVGITPNAAGLVGTATPTPAACAVLNIEQRTQRRFRNFFQILVAVLAVAALLLLVWAGIRLAVGFSIDGLLSGVGGLVTGAGAGFLEKQRRDARDAHKAALDAYLQAGC